MLWNIRITSQPMCFALHYLSSVYWSHYPFIASNTLSFTFYSVVNSGYMCTCVYVCKGQLWALFLNNTTSPFCSDRVSLARAHPVGLETSCLDMTIEPQGSVSLHLPISWITGVCHHTWHFYVVLEIKLRSSHMQWKYFTIWAISSVPVINYFSNITVFRCLPYFT